MLNLSRDDRKNLRAALTSGFRSYASLKIFVSDSFDEFRLDEIATSQAIRIAADDLIAYCEETGSETNLILALCRERPGNSEVQKLMGRLQGFVQQRIVINPASTAPSAIPFVLPDPYVDQQLESFLPQPLAYETDLGKLLRGLQQCGNAVCKLSFTDQATTGTGVLIAPDLVLTNYHVLSRQTNLERSQLTEKAKTVLFEFRFISEEHDSLVSPDIFRTEATDPLVSFSPTNQLDYALLRVDPKIIDSGYVKPVPIGTPGFSVSSKDELNIVQHPGGTMMQVSLSGSGVVQVHPEQGRVWYVNRTQGGSSGSPCFNREWELVALHHASVSRGFGSAGEGILMTAISAKISSFLV